MVEGDEAGFEFGDGAGIFGEDDSEVSGGEGAAASWRSEARRRLGDGFDVGVGDTIPFEKYHGRGESSGASLRKSWKVAEYSLGMGVTDLGAGWRAQPAKVVARGLAGGEPHHMWAAALQKDQLKRLGLKVLDQRVIDQMSLSSRL